MKSAMSTHFRERKDYFAEIPRRAGKKIWEIDLFGDFKNVRSGDHREC